MGFYELSKDKRVKQVDKIYSDILNNLMQNLLADVVRYFSDKDTYIRKAAYEVVGKIAKKDPKIIEKIIKSFDTLILDNNEKVRQSVIYAAGEIGIFDFNSVKHLFDIGLRDDHHTVRNGVIGALKKMSEKNPVPILNFAKLYLHHPDAEIRRQICHGIELRGRTHPEDILPLLRELQSDKSARVRRMLIHVLGQISYKKGCLEKVVADLKTWENSDIIKLTIQEILNIHEQYKKFARMSLEEVESYIKRELKVRLPG